MAEEVLITSPGKITSHLTSSLLAVAFLTSFGSSMLYGYNLAVVNSPAGYIKEFYNRTVVNRNGTGLNEEALTLMYSLTVSVFAIGGLVGSLMVGMLVTKFGRKGTVVNSTVLVFLAASLMGFSRICGSPEMVIFGRFVTGIHSGISLSVVPMYLGEIAPKNLRGFLGLMPSIFICAGVFSAQVLGLHELLGKEEHWPLFLSLVVVPTFIQLMLLPWFPESPRYLLIEKHNVHATITALKWYRAKCNIQAEIEEMQEEQRSLSSVETMSVWQLLLDHTVRWQVLSVVVINIGMQLSGIDAPSSSQIESEVLYAVTARSQDMPPVQAKITILPLTLSCSPQIWFYTNDIFENAGIPAPEIQYTTVGTGAIEIVAGLIGCFTIERLGRRPLIIGGFGVMGMCCAGITLSLILQTHVPFMKYVSVGCVVGIIAGFCIGPAGVPFLITAELFKQSHRPAAYTVGGSLNWMSNFTIGFIFPFLQMSAGSYCYLVFCSVCLAVAIYVYFVIPETKNKTFVEISQMFATKEAVEESQALTHPDQLKLKKMNGYGSLENGSLEFDSSSSCP
ncbi:Solute carrier family 2, facilitated glucose transporter member 9 [Anabarilius grahami]|uniref:Solute carrier family 2, facilitated glucose transporter member 9 n=1 Tax=Anabarilius grahami TaxID=495550 RepID=A0A3N0YTS4_ANAGA|nr:Solute carrier family 2, facilitated glucose transporter member 9 [Anabarilius grahami]